MGRNYNFYLCTLSYIVTLCSVAGTDALESNFLASIDWEHWHIMTESDIRVLAIDNFAENYTLGNKITKAVTPVIPVKNVADDPLNVFVGAQKLNASIWQQVLGSAPNKIVGAVGATEVHPLLKEIMKNLYPRLEEAVEKRREILIELKRDRIKEKYNSMVKNLAVVVKQVVTNEMDESNIWSNIIEELKNIGIAKEIVDVLSLHVVKEEVTLAISKTGVSNELNAKILERIVPFVYEGISKMDDALIDKHTDEVASHVLDGILTPLYKLLIGEAISEAKKIDEFLKKDGVLQFEKTSEMFDEIIHEEFIIPIRRSFSIFHYFGQIKHKESQTPCS